MSNDNLWENLYWSTELTRPDHFAKVLNSIIRKDGGDSEYFIYDQQAAKDAMKDDLVQENIHQFKSVNKQNNHVHLTHYDKLRLGQIDKQLNSQKQSNSSLHVQNYTSYDKPVFVLGLSADERDSNNATETRSESSNRQAHVTLPLRGSSMNIHPNATWNQNGHTVAGQNSSLSIPFGLFVSDDQTIYVADSFYHRIVAWKEGETNEQVVAGGYEQGNDTHQLNGPSDVIVNKETDSLIICDRRNGRVVRWPRQNGTSGETIISNITCWGVTMNEHESLYVSDKDKDQVIRYRKGESQGTIVAGGNERGDRLDQLNEPHFIFVDRDHSVFVSDWGNHRVMKWIEGAKEGVVVAGGQGEGNSLSQLSRPLGILVDQLDTVYVADRGNNRIVRWRKGAKQGTIIAGGNGEGEQANQLNYPEGLSFDRHGHLYVADGKNRRVQRFTIEMPLK
ncbi:unnamed protein product [Adineta steineri]|uniref:Uncharacterized protein n=1 Tax=Adineta steineri TaxID=433720 RepID=A0A819PWJ6_9BILA|nr:unnamed protein product [Adineta steineri]CAF4015560.1 unnamed protein product [Adineta steineri]